MVDSADALPPPPDRAVAVQPAVRSARRWIAQAVLILASVAVGFLASEFGQYRQDGALADKVLRAVTEEVKQNEAVVSAAAAQHREWEKALCIGG
jgi:imidazolonepropionase-like amidohydrolase